MNTIGELLQKTEDDLLAITNFGQKSLDEVIQKLDERGLQLRPRTVRCGRPDTALRDAPGARTAPRRLELHGRDRARRDDQCEPSPARRTPLHCSASMRTP